MTLAAMLMSFIFPACAAAGAAGVPPAAQFDLARLERPKSPNSALLAPAGIGPAPDIAAPLFAVPPEALYQALTRVAQSAPRTTLQLANNTRHEAHYVARSAVFNFPDLVTIAVQPDGAGSRPIIYSRSLYGRSDFDVNRRRIATWLARLPAALAEHP